MHCPTRSSSITAATAAALFVFVVFVATAAGALACSRTEEKTKNTTIITTESASGATSSAASVAPTSASVPVPPEAPPAPITPITWTGPSSWTKQPPSNEMRIAQYLVPHVAGDAVDAECVVSRFGGGSVNENVDRWIRQFDPATTQPLKKATRDVGGMHVTTLDIVGSYKGLMMQTAAAPQPKAGWRMVGAIVEGPGALWFFKMTGPDKTVKAATPAFEKMLDSLKR